jgi:site-specific DNA-methyltransferase (adenine-specific)/modification methylase
MRIERIGDCVLYNADCREVLPTLGKVDAVVTDPPYGIGVDATMHKQGGTKYGKAAAAKREYAATNWDFAPITTDDCARLRAASEWQIIFGGNYFDLPPARCWLVWDKKNGGNAFADCELAWTNLDKPVRKIDWMWNGMLRRGGEERGEHPTQKPVGVLTWCLEQLPAECNTILDPFMGSGTTGVACVKLGRKFIGIEIEPKYFDIACRRIEAATKEPRLPLPEPKPVQQSLLEGGR